jgi:hypothetical protein
MQSSPATMTMNWRDWGKPWTARIAYRQTEIWTRDLRNWSTKRSAESLLARWQSLSYTSNSPRSMLPHKLRSAVRLNHKRTLSLPRIHHFVSQFLPLWYILSQSLILSHLSHALYVSCQIHPRRLLSPNNNNEEYTVWSFSLCYVHPSRATPFFAGTNILLSTPLPWHIQSVSRRHRTCEMRRAMYLVTHYVCACAQGSY